MEEQNLGRPRTLKEYVRLYLTGFGMGTADIIPGVSGGTIAFIMGIYDTLVDAIKSFNLDAIRLALGRKFAAFVDHTSLRFLIALGLGILTAVFTLSKVLGDALETQPTYIFALFGGLVLASIVAVAPSVKWNTAALVFFVIATIFAFWLTGLGVPEAPVLADAVDGATPAVSYDLLTLFFSGMIAIVAMILPGISGSFILVILGQYRVVLGLVNERNIVPLFVFAIGCLIGLVLFSRILSFLLRHYRSLTLAALVGFMAGSLRKLWIEATVGADTMSAAGNTPNIALVLILVVLGFVIVTLLDHVSSRNNPVVKRIFARA